MVYKIARGRINLKVDQIFVAHLVELQYRLDTFKSNMVNSKLYLIRTFLPIYFATSLSSYV